MDCLPIPATAESELTRERLIKGTLLEAFRASPIPGVMLRTDAELEETLNATFRTHPAGSDLHVFGYGSLMWNPAMDVAQARVAHVPGWHRRFCFRTVFGRGTPQQPGAMLALDRGGTCRGVLFRIEAAKAAAELRLLWRREMLAGSYDARWVTARVGASGIRALTFVARRQHERYIGGRPIEHVVDLIRTGVGPLGTSRAYFDCTVEALQLLGIRDAGIERLRRVLLSCDAGDRDARTALPPSR